MPGSATESNNGQPRLDELISLHEAADICGLSQAHLALMIRQKRLWGKKVGRNWVTTSQAVQEYLARDRRPGPKSLKNP